MNFLSSRARRRVLQIIPFGIICLVYSIVYGLIEKGILGNHPTYPSTGNPYEFRLLIPSLLALIFGLFIGLFEVLYLNRLFRKNSFLKKLIFKGAIYILITTTVIFLLVTINTSYNLGIPPWHKTVWQYTVAFFLSFAFWSVEIYLTLAISLCLFYAEVSDNIGQSVLLNFFTGKYHHPVEEERIFLFLDMKSSTTIAKKLGHHKYFKMLKEYYSDLSNPIIRYGGEIYQYVGDEVVVTWKVKKGIKKNKCLQCFFAMKEAINKRAAHYEAQYGVVPTFKAGYHLGKVTTGEIGVIKKEIIFSGDVLNTAARLQGLCNEYGVDIMTSGKLIRALKLGDEFKTEALGEQELRGRGKKTALFTVEKIST